MDIFSKMLTATSWRRRSSGFSAEPKLDVAYLWHTNFCGRSVINVNGHLAYAGAIAELKRNGELGRRCRCRTAPYLNNIIEQDHRFIKKRITAGSLRAML